MREELLKLRENAYAPYSKFNVACIVIMKDGQKFKGVNVENASYGGTICAERVAITSAIACGYRKHDFKELYVMTGEKIGTPCLICRQTINELFERNCKIICMNIWGEQKEYSVSELCPYPFDESDLL